MKPAVLIGRVFIVTGGARGLGRAMVLALAEAGARVTAVDLPSSEAQMNELLQAADDRGLRLRILPQFADITQESACAGATEATVKHFGAVHGLVNNAGLGMQDIGAVLVGKMTKFYEVDADRWRATIDVNLNGAFLMAKAAVPYLLTNGWGRIVNITTSFITMGWGGGSPYGPSKAALEVATEAWAKDLSGTGITVNALLPGGAADTRMIPQNEVKDRANLVQPEAMGPPVVWLLSPESDGVSGFRFNAKEWNPSLWGVDAARRSGARAGW